MTPRPFAPRPLPDDLSVLTDLSLDLRWNNRPPADRLWARLAPEVWERTRNPHLILQLVSETRLNEVAQDEEFRRDLEAAARARQRALDGPGWFAERHGDAGLRGIAYFSLEFGLGESLPIYAGGLGILAGDHVKTASDMGVPLTAVGLLYDRGYFRQQLAHDGWQLEAYPFNAPSSLPISPVRDREGGWLRVTLPLPGRDLLLRVWQVNVGRVTLYLLDSNDPMNRPWDRAVTSSLYSGDRDRRLVQELVLGVAGWRVLEALGIEADVCHLNEGHAAFVVPSRAAQFQKRHGVSFAEALWATRPGNLFTTHTPVAAGFDRFDPQTVGHYLQPFADEVGLPVGEILMLGQDKPFGLFNMAWLAARGSGHVNAVSALHEEVSRSVFSPIYPRWPVPEVPMGHVTNAVHMPSWASARAHDLWAKTQDPDGSAPDAIETASLATVVASPALDRISDGELWAFRSESRRALVEYVRGRLEQQVRELGLAPEIALRARQALDPDVLTVGFARRFAAYKRPQLLLEDMERLYRLLRDPARPVQFIIAGKAHPSDNGGKELVRAIVQASLRPEFFGRIVFLADYDIMLTSELVAGVDVWLNNPRRPMEASGTSGMKVLANGGLNLSELDGWWAEAYTPEVGWALGDGREHDEPEWDTREAEQLYTLLEQAVAPEFYGRNAEGLPDAWLRRVRASMTQLTPRFDSPRMVREYVEKFYLPAAAGYQERSADGGRVAKELKAWHRRLEQEWPQVRLTDRKVVRTGTEWTISVRVTLGGLSAEDVQIGLYAEQKSGFPPAFVEMTRRGAGPYYDARVPADRPALDYTPRAVSHHPGVLVPQEVSQIAWLEGPPPPAVEPRPMDGAAASSRRMATP